MAKFSVNVEVLRAYVVEVEANNAEEAVAKVEDMTAPLIDHVGIYVDTCILVDDEVEIVE